MGWSVSNANALPLGKTTGPKESVSGSGRKTKMTEKEFYAKLNHSIATSSEDTMSVMQPSETGQQFLNRMLGAN